MTQGLRVTTGRRRRQKRTQLSLLHHGLFYFWLVSAAIVSTQSTGAFQLTNAPSSSSSSSRQHQQGRIQPKWSPLQLQGSANDDDNNDGKKQPYFTTQTKDKDNHQEARRPTRSVDTELLDDVKNSFFFQLTKKVATDAFVMLRKTAATALTESLSPEEQEELLARTVGGKKIMRNQANNPQKKTEAKNIETAVEEEEHEEHEEEIETPTPMMSVQENMAAAEIKEIQRRQSTATFYSSSEEWEREKALLLQQAEQAAQERMETELAIQRQCMEQEKQALLAEAQSAQQQELQQQQQALLTLQKEVKELEKEAKSLKNKENQNDNSNELLEKMEQALQEKEAQAKQDEKKIQELQRQLESAATASKATGTKPRIRAGRYTPEEYRSLTDEEKEMVKKLRQEQGMADYDDDEEEEKAQTSDNNNNIHPILGPVIQDFGYKRVHILSAGRLGTIPIWKKQRIYRHTRAKAMVNDKWKSMNLGLPGIICLHEDPDGKLVILDGQHRVGMMMLLRDKQRKEMEQAAKDYDNDADYTKSLEYIDFDQILVEVYPQRDRLDDKHAQELFLEINKAEPVQLVDLPGMASSKDRKIITDAVDQLYDLYPKMFSPSQRCRVPNVNVDNLRNSLFAANVMKTHKLTTSKKLLEWVLEQNKKLGEKYAQDEEARRVTKERAWIKASDNGFYLGLDSSWLYN